MRRFEDRARTIVQDSGRTGGRRGGVLRADGGLIVARFCHSANWARSNAELHRKPECDLTGPSYEASTNLVCAALAGDCTLAPRCGREARKSARTPTVLGIQGIRRTGLGDLDRGAGGYFIQVAGLPWVAEQGLRDACGRTQRQHGRRSCASRPSIPAKPAAPFHRTAAPLGRLTSPVHELAAGPVTWTSRNSSGVLRRLPPALSTLAQRCNVDVATPCRRANSTAGSCRWVNASSSCRRCSIPNRRGTLCFFSSSFMLVVLPRTAPTSARCGLNDAYFCPTRGFLGAVPAHRVYRRRFSRLTLSKKK